MKRKIIVINANACDGCGKCVDVCHKGAIGLQGGKAVLVKDDYCDGLGDCLPVCPKNAIRFIKREAAPYDEAAAKAHMLAQKNVRRKVDTIAQPEVLECGMQEMRAAHLTQWPVQIKLTPVNASCFNGSALLVAADCSAYAYGDFHREFMSGRVTLIGCPKLDGADYADKLTEILKQNVVRSVTVARMSVPCCGGLEHAMRRAVRDCGKTVALRVATLSPEGEILKNGYA